MVTPAAKRRREAARTRSGSHDERVRRVVTAMSRSMAVENGIALGVVKLQASDTDARCCRS
jgi:hypothetical protein